MNLRCILAWLMFLYLQFDFMDMISLQGKTNFFEKRVSDYAKAGVNVSASAKAETTASKVL